MSTYQSKQEVFNSMLNNLRMENWKLRNKVLELQKKLDNQMLKVINLKRGTLIKRRKRGKIPDSAKEYMILCINCAFDWREILSENELKDTRCPKCYSNDLNIRVVPKTPVFYRRALHE